MVGTGAASSSAHDGAKDEARASKAAEAGSHLVGGFIVFCSKRVETIA